MPGVPTLAAELGLDHKTVAGAIRLLEQDGLLIGQGVGRPRRIRLPEKLAPPSLRVAILAYEPLAQSGEKLFLLRQRLSAQGHAVFFAGKSQMELGFDVRRIARLAQRTAADAWVVVSGPRETLAWFAEQESPVFALFGRRHTLPIAGAGPDHLSADRAAVRRLIELGHCRMVLLIRESLRACGPGAAERAIFEEMEAHGLPTSPYNMPEWKDSPEDFRRVLDELYRVTPPTALFIDEPFIFHAAREHLARRGIFAPQQVSLICTDPDPTFAWSDPSVAHIAWDYSHVERCVVQWANNIARGKDDRRQTLTKAEFVDGGTVGRVPMDRL
jgi:DNA-binding LacI/PurR family transcriptional regulator